MIWKGIAVVTNTESPIVVVLRYELFIYIYIYMIELIFNTVYSGSMRPAFHRGDLLFLSLPKNDPVAVNDICVFKLPERPIPIVHRVIKIHTE
jgi:signal peptidase